jgi:hypothetical protein
MIARSSGRIAFAGASAMVKRRPEAIETDLKNRAKNQSSSIEF